MSADFTRSGGHGTRAPLLTQNTPPRPNKYALRRAKSRAPHTGGLSDTRARGFSFRAAAVLRFLRRRVVFSFYEAPDHWPRPRRRNRRGYYGRLSHRTPSKLARRMMTSLGVRNTLNIPMMPMAKGEL